ncbi:jg24033 [Pararge aegeria aegeria]|uniref:Jg24033 protein n=1 Tax=Pararge aegeria aegeria TaxID=348720 RepID=A0A8S4RDR9_9NEOP|nr:jg24033 [Pararge aegeria aegeria]
MEVEPVSFVRDSTRNLLKINRRKHRDEESDLRRSLKEISITSEDIASIANKLKTKPAITAVDLRTLKNGLINDVKHCAVFLNVNGALRGLVRELTGLQVDRQCAAAGCCCNLALGDARVCTAVAKAAGSYLVAALDNLTVELAVDRQCAAAGCCCNLALGDARVCTAVAKAAGSYLVAALDNLTVELAVTCAWALGNLAGSGNRVCSILAAQGAVSKLSDYHANQDLQVAAIYALLLFAYEMKDELKPEHLQKILQTLSKLELTSDSLHLLFILSCHEHFAESMKEELLEKLLKHLPSAIEIHNRQTKIHYNLIYILRVLANSNTITNEDKQFTEKEVVE